MYVCTSYLNPQKWHNALQSVLQNSLSMILIYQLKIVYFECIILKLNIILAIN